MNPVQELPGSVLIAPFAVTLQDICDRFCFNQRRKDMFEMLARYVEETRQATTKPIAQFISGSFVDNKEEPGDIDIANIIPTCDDASFDLYFNNKLMKIKYRLDIMPIINEGDALSIVSFIRLGVYYSHSKGGAGPQRGFLWLI